MTFREFGFFMEAVLEQIYFIFPWMTLMIGVVLLIQMPMTCRHRGFYHFTHAFSHVDAFLAPCCVWTASSWIDFTRSGWAPGWGLMESFSDPEEVCALCSSGLSVIVITMISPSKFVSYLCLFFFFFLVFIYLVASGLSCGMHVGSSSLTRDRTRAPSPWERGVLSTAPPGKSLTCVLKDQQNRKVYQPEALGITLPAAKELNCCLSMHHWALLLAQRDVRVHLSLEESCYSETCDLPHFSKLPLSSSRGGGSTNGGVSENLLSKIWTGRIA